MRQSSQIIRKASYVARNRIAPSSTRRSALKRSASTLSPDATNIPEICDVFDVPARLVDDDSATYLPENFREQQSYIPSPFCPPSSFPSLSMTAILHVKKPTSGDSALNSRTLSYTPPMLLFDGPAHPSRPIIVTSRYRRASSMASGVKLSAYCPPEPIIFDGPARPRRRGPATKSKSEANSLMRSIAAAATLMAALFSYQAYRPQSSATKSLPL